MPLTTDWQPLEAGTRLVAPGTFLPPQWQVENDSAGAGWSRLAHTLDNKQLERELASAGWTFFFVAIAITTTSFGFSRPRMFDVHWPRLTAAVTLQKCNCVQIDDVSVRSLLGIPYVRISAHPRHIQKGLIFSGQ
jgi:hypothetical protein